MIPALWRGAAALVPLAVLGLRVQDATAQVHLELFGGSAFNVPSLLRIQQRGESALRLTARYATRAIEAPIYYAVRVAAGGDESHWEIELVHHKLHLRNPLPEIERFSVTHGYNLVFASHAWLGRGFAVRAGAGVVLAHPESTVRGRRLREDGGVFGVGYYLSGPAVELAATRPLLGRGRIRVLAETKATAAYARVPVAGGHADVPNAAFHILVGVGYR
ncbi:MAG: hypothetical protein HY704_08230 [Gemmatimonadetes bacterium]|nr:hypothetical protein [Gemmatimonadota bacterium]